MSPIRSEPDGAEEETSGVPTLRFMQCEAFLFKDDTAHATLSAILDDFRKRDEFTDVTIFAENIELRAHKVVLATIPFFRRLFFSGMQESHAGEIHIKEIDPDAITCIVNYAYTGQVKITLENATELLHAVRMMELGVLEKACCNFLIGNINRENCIKLLAVADMYDLKDMREMALQYAGMNITSVCHDPDLMSLDSTVVREFLATPIVQGVIREGEGQSLLLMRSMLTYAHHMIEKKSELSSILQPFSSCHFTKEIIDELEQQYPDLSKDPIWITIAENEPRELPFPIKNYPLQPQITRMIFHGDLRLCELIPNVIRQTSLMFNLFDLDCAVSYGYHSPDMGHRIHLIIWLDVNYSALCSAPEKDRNRLFFDWSIEGEITLLPPGDLSRSYRSKFSNGGWSVNGDCPQTVSRNLLNLTYTEAIRYASQDVVDFKFVIEPKIPRMLES